MYSKIDDHIYQSEHRRWIIGVITMIVLMQTPWALAQGGNRASRRENRTTERNQSVASDKNLWNEVENRTRASNDVFGHAQAETTELQKTNRQIRSKISELRNSEDEKRRKATADELRELLNTAFELDYEQRNKELAKLEKRVSKLRNQLSRRKDAREDIIDVRVKSLLYEVEGIGGPVELGFDSNNFRYQQHNGFDRQILGDRSSQSRFGGHRPWDHAKLRQNPYAPQTPPRLQPVAPRIPGITPAPPVVELPIPEQQVAPESNRLRTENPNSSFSTPSIQTPSFENKSSDKPSTGTKPASSEVRRNAP